MAKFKATSIEALDYDFNPFADVTGTIPEPSTELVDAYNLEIEKIRQSVRLRLAERDAEIDKAAAKGEDPPPLDLDEVQKASDGYRERLVLALEALCGGELKSDFLRSLPFRLTQAFSDWLSGELSPKGATTDTI